MHNSLLVSYAMVVMVIGLMAWVLIALLNSIKKVKKQEVKEPILKGQTWVMKAGDKSPWPRQESLTEVTVIDVKDGWVRYYRPAFMTLVTDGDERLEESSFRYCYPTLKKEPIDDQPANDDTTAIVI
jgi:hypothetical protein